MNLSSSSIVILTYITRPQPLYFRHPTVTFPFLHILTNHPTTARITTPLYPFRFTHHFTHAPPLTPGFANGNPTGIIVQLSILLFPSSNGGYLASNKTSNHVGTRILGLSWVKRLNPHLPWYDPCPEGPTPPKGRCGMSACWAQSFTRKEPDWVREKMWVEREGESVKR